MKRNALAALLLASATLLQAAPLEPILHHIASPRRAIDLAGAWRRADVACIRHDRVDEKGKKTYTLEEVPLDEATAVWKDSPVPSALRVGDAANVYLRRDFVLPPDLPEGAMVTVFFERIGESFSVSLNGGMPQERPATFDVPQRLDVSADARPGTNTLTVALRKDGVRRPWIDTPVWEGSDTVGITRPVHVEVSGPVYIQDVAVETQVVPRRVFLARVTVANHTDREVEADLAAAVAGAWTNAPVRVKLPARGTARVEVRRDWPSAELWSPAHPKLFFCDFRLASAADGRVWDAYRQRFGFRQISIRGNRLLLNGKPFLNRRCTFLPEQRTDKAVLFEWFQRNRERGVNGFRVFGADTYRLADAADEFGALLQPVAHAGTGAAWRSEKFWPLYRHHLVQMVEAHRNHPSIIYWCVSNEFGTIYGGDEGGPREEPTTEKQVASARLVEEADPTRPWTACGEVDLGYPVKGSVGPAPLRNFHYPIGLCADGSELPDIAYWYADGKLSWQRISTKDKPLCISEDFYHGMTDQHLGMAKFAGDSHYTEEGYFKAFSKAVRTCAEGYYYSGLATWEPWCVYPGEKKSRYYDYGQLQPDYLIAMREFFPNLRAGEKAERQVFAYNQWFEDYDCVLAREDRFRGKTVSASVSDPFRLGQGGRYEQRIAIEPPARAPAGSRYEVAFALRTTDGRVLAERTYVFRVYPPLKKLRVPRGTALLATPDSPLRRSSFRGGMYDTAAAAIASAPRRIVVDKPLSDAEGVALEQWVRRGGQAMILEAPEGSWSPVAVEYRRRQTFVWRRSLTAMPDIAEESMRSWMPDGYVGHSGCPKPAENAQIFWDAGRKEGLTSAQIFRVFRGKGAWLVCQLPVSGRYDVEPVAPYVLQSALQEFARDPARPALRVAIDSGAATNAPVAAMFDALRIPVDADPDQAGCLVVDGTAGLTDEQAKRSEAALARGCTVFWMNLATNTDANLLARHGLRLAQPPVVECPVPWNPASIAQVDNGVKHVTRVAEPGLLHGVSNDDLFWWKPGEMWNRFRYAGTGLHPPMKFNGPRQEMHAASAILEATEGASRKPVFRTEPAAFAEVAVGKGTLVVSTLKMVENATASPERVGRTLRTMLHNAGVDVARDPPLVSWEPLDIAASMNRNLWNDPLRKKADGTFEPAGWFGDDNDMRYFPVNLCGWSMEARNHCPKEPFPETPLTLGCVPFRLQDPEKNGGRGCIVVGPGESVTISLPTPVKAGRLQFLGAKSGFDSGPHAGDVLRRRPRPRRLLRRRPFRHLPLERPGQDRAGGVDGGDHQGPAGLALPLAGRESGAGAADPDDRASKHRAEGLDRRDRDHRGGRS